jgi:hypothetical protein
MGTETSTGGDKMTKEKGKTLSVTFEAIPNNEKDAVVITATPEMLTLLKKVAITNESATSEQYRYGFEFTRYKIKTFVANMFGEFKLLFSKGIIDTGTVRYPMTYAEFLQLHKDLASQKYKDFVQALANYNNATFNVEVD